MSVTRVALVVLVSVLCPLSLAHASDLTLDGQAHLGKLQGLPLTVKVTGTPDAPTFLWIDVSPGPVIINGNPVELGFTPAKILLALANAQSAAGRHKDTIATLDYLREKNPGFRSADGHLMYARALEESGATARAIEEYAALANYYPGAEARVRQAMLHKKLGEKARADALFAALLKDARLAPKHFRRAEREWIELAERESREAPGQRSAS